MKKHGIPRMIIGGSFTAGRANLLTSDVDYISDVGRLPRKMTREFDLAINTALDQLGVQAKLYISEFPAEIGKPRERSYPDDLASSNPVLFLIYPNSIEMHIYPTKIWETGRSYNSVMSHPEIFQLSQ